MPQKYNKNIDKSEKKLLIVNDLGIGDRCGGTQKRIYQLAKELLKKRVFTSIFVIADKSAESLKEDFTYKIHIVYSDKNTIAQTTEEIIVAEDICLVQIHNTSLLSTRAIPIAKKYGKPVIFFAHDYWPVCGRRSFYTKDKKQCKGTSILKCMSCIGIKSLINLNLKINNHINKCDIGIATSNFMIEIYEKNNVLRKKWKKVTPWVGNEYLSKKTNNVKQEKKIKTILYVGYLDEEKGFFDILDVFLNLKKKVLNLKLVAIGDVFSKNKTRIDNILKENNAENDVKLKGFINDHNQLANYYNEADLFAFTSKLEESFGQTWAQALACETPIIAYNTGSVKELLAGYGTIVKNGDKEQLKSSIESFFCDKNTQRKAIEKARLGRKYAQKNFSIKKALPILVNIYDNW